MEVWKTFLEYDNQRGHTFFEVSTEGRIRNGRTGQIRKPQNFKGYDVFFLNTGGKRYSFSVHRLVAQAFIPNPENKPQVDHINRDRSDNRVENLRWVTNKENCGNPLTIAHKRALIDDAWCREQPYKKSPIVLLLEKQIPL